MIEIEYKRIETGLSNRVGSWLKYDCCSLCSALVNDKDTHTKFHNSQQSQIQAAAKSYEVPRLAGDGGL